MPSGAGRTAATSRCRRLGIGQVLDGDQEQHAALVLRQVVQRAKQVALPAASPLRSPNKEVDRVRRLIGHL